MLGETCFSGAALTLLGIVLTPVLTAFGWLYRDLRSANARLAEAHQSMQAGIPVMDEAESALRGKAPGRRH